MLSVAVVDDNTERAGRLASMISSFAVSSPELDVVSAADSAVSDRGDAKNIDLLHFRVTIFSAVAELSTFLTRHAVDIAFINVENGGVRSSAESGGTVSFVGEAARLFPGDSDTQIVFLTRVAGRVPNDEILSPHPYAVGRMHFLAWPVASDELRMVLLRAVWQLRQTRERMIRIDSGGVMYMLSPSEIRYAESHRRVLRVYAGDMIETYSTLAEFMVMLPSYFLQCHKSYLVNMNYVRQFDGSSILLATGEEIPVSQRRRSYAKARLRGYVRGLGEVRK